MKVRVDENGYLEFCDNEAVGALNSLKGYQCKLIECIMDAMSKYYKTNSGDLNIDKVIFSDPATIVFWDDGDKTIVKCTEGDAYNPEMGIALCTIKKIFGSSYGEYKKHVGKLVKKANEKGTADDVLSEK